MQRPGELAARLVESGELEDFVSGGLDKITVTVPTIEISDDDCAAMIENLRRQKADWNTVERKSADGDRVVIDVVSGLKRSQSERRFVIEKPFATSCLEADEAANLARETSIDRIASCTSWPARSGAAGWPGRPGS